jgi:diguanylate cyclase (GGDEF)-like protein
MNVGMAAKPLNQLEGALGVLFEKYSSDQIRIIIAKVGLRVDWQLTDQESYSEKTRKRAYWTRVFRALDQHTEDERSNVLKGLLVAMDFPIDDERNEPDAEKDVLLPLLSRAQFNADFIQFCQRASNSSPLALVVVDLDHFKTVNDSFGHQAGDEVLIAVSSTLLGVVEAKGHAYRYGGEELCLLLPNFEVGEAVALAERARSQIAALHYERIPERVTASFGVAACPPIPSIPAELFDAADKALYRAKASGRNRVESGIIKGEIVSPSRLFASIEDRVGVVDMAIQIVQGTCGTFIMNVINKSDEELQVTKVSFACNGIAVTEWECDAQRSCKIGPRSQIAVSWNSRTDPVERLQHINNIWDRNFSTHLDVVFQAKVLGRLRIVGQKILIQVDRGARRVWHHDW